MRIAFLTGEYPPDPGGVGDYTRCLALALAERGHDVGVITDDEHEFPTSSPSESAVDLHRRISSWGWRCWERTIETMHDLAPDVLHIQYQTGAYGMHPAVNTLPWRLKRHPNRPSIVVTFHDLLEPYLFPKAGPLRRWVTLRLAQDADAVVVTSVDDAVGILEVEPRIIPIGSNIAVAPPHNYDRQAWRESLGIRPDDMVISYFGLLSRNKGADILIDALASLREYPERRFILLLIGGEAIAPHDQSYAETVAAQIDRLRLHDSVLRTGHVDESTVSAHLLASDCMAIPFRNGVSFRSGSLMAGLAHGLPFVTTYTGGQGLIVGGGNNARLVDGENVKLVPPLDSEALAEAIVQLSRDNELRWRMSEGARGLGAYFTWDSIAEEHERLYEACKIPRAML